MGFKTFEEIEAWQEARKLMQSIRNICRKENVKRDWTWIDQISRASLSIMANIAEGNDTQSNPESVVFFGYAKRSATEVRSHLYYGLDEKYLSKQEFNELFDQTKKIAAQLANLIRYLKQKKPSPAVPSSEPQKI